MNPSVFVNYLSIIKAIIEIAILWFVIYHIILFFEGTRAVYVLRGIVILLATFFIFQKLGFERLEWLFTKLFAISVISILIIFHPEIRQGLSRLGQRHLFGPILREEEVELILQEIVKASDSLSKYKIGALIAIAKEMPLAAYVESGIKIDAEITSEVIQTIFTPGSLLHDGGIIIQHGRIVAAGCLFPLSENQDLGRIFGMRHRAAVGLSEETDTIVIVVSEERGDISLAYKGRLYQKLNREELLSNIRDNIKIKKEDAAKQG